MRCDYGIDWLLVGEPRPAQIEALARSYTGFGYRTTLNSTVAKFELPHAGMVAKGWGHWMQMRVGKTPTALNEFMLAKRDLNVRFGVIISPNKFKWTWDTEIPKFGVDVEHFIHDADKKKLLAKVKEFIKKGEGIVVVNYEALIQTEVQEALAMLLANGGMLIADESVKLKNPTGTFFKQSYKLSKLATITRTLTGKPAPQSPLDYFSQLQMAGAIQGYVHHAFKARFCATGGFKGKKIVGVKNPDILADLLRKHAFIAERKDWATYIESRYIDRRVEMHPAQLDAYKQMEKEFIVWLDENTSVSVEVASHKHAKLQQISSGFIYDEEGKSHAIIPFADTPKFKDLLEYIEESAIDKVIVVYVHKPVGEALLAELAEYQPALIAGDQLMKRLGKDVTAEKDRFNRDPSCRVMVAQETAVKYGFTLMGTEANPVLDLAFYENSYSLDDRAQTEERPQGNGQIAALNVVDYYSTPVEAKVIGALQRKEAVSKVVVDHYLNRTAT